MPFAFFGRSPTGRAFRYIFLVTLFRGKPSKINHRFSTEIETKKDAAAIPNAFAFQQKVYWKLVYWKIERLKDWKNWKITEKLIFAFFSGN
jgi:hypothetical protein